MAPHSSTLAWKIPWMEEPGWLESMGSLSRAQLSDLTFTFHFHALEKEMATHSSVLAWRIPWTAEPGGLLVMGLHRVGHEWNDLAAAAAAVAKLCPTLLCPVYCSPPGCSVYGIFQARILEWVAISFSTFHAFLYAVFSLGMLFFPTSLLNSYPASGLNAIFYEATLVNDLNLISLFWPPSSCPQCHLFILFQSHMPFLIIGFHCFCMPFPFLPTKLEFPSHLIVSTMAPKTEPGTE